MAEADSEDRTEGHLTQTVWEELYVYVKGHVSPQDQSWVEDVVQDIFLEAIEDGTDLPGVMRLQSFFHARAHTKVKNFYRANGNGKRHFSLERLIEMQTKEKVFFKEFLTDDIETYLEKQGLSVLIHDAIEGLPYPYREVVKLRVYQQVPFQAISVAFEKKEATVRQWSRRGFRMVQKKLIKQIGCLPYSSNGRKHGKTKKERNGHKSLG